MTKAFKSEILRTNGKGGKWVLHPIDATPVWVPAKKGRKPVPRRERKRSDSPAGLVAIFAENGL